MATAEERHVPRYHFVAPEGPCAPFDPNGALFWRGRYHLFYIFQDPGLPRRGHSWGHASSPDLVNWRFHPPALKPGGDVPEEGIFSGCALITREGVPALVYYGINAGICIAFAEDDDLDRWRRHPANPVIAEPKRGDPAFDLYRVFDPHAWLDGDVYHMILGGLVKPHNVHDTAYLFTSRDLENWDYQRPFYSPNPNWTDANEDCACPDFFKLGPRQVLMCISHPRGTRYYLGRYHAGTFIPESHHRLTYPGGASFAPESLLDGMGRRMFWAWAIAQRRPGTDQFATMTLPSVLTATDSGGLMIEPVREVELLRRNGRETAALTLDDDERLFPALAGDCLELRLAILPRGARRAGLSVRAAPNRIEETRIVYDAAARTLSIDSTRSSRDPAVFRAFPMATRAEKRDHPVQTAPCPLDEDGMLRLNVFLDASIIEVYANDRCKLTGRIYPTLAGSRQTRLFAEGGPAAFSPVHAWDMAALVYSTGDPAEDEATSHADAVE
ncbi:MAG: glycoside hydrolase family 32 protein [Gammaproteobacteria bacterium]|nr:glycoside hydrolase family 32 protein [Gammaproteobacteria bacterium]